MNIIFMGTPDFSVPALEALIEAGHRIATVYTQPPRRAGRGKKDRPTPVHQKADQLGLTVLTPETLKTSEAQEAFRALDADIAVVVAYGLILPQAVLDAPRRGCLNIHASLLPRWRGAAPIHRAIMAGDQETGVTIMQMEAGLDTGPMLMSEALPIDPRDTTDSLHDRLATLGAKLIVQTLATLDTLTPVPQPEDGVTYADKIDKAEARIDWTQSAETVSRQIRGLSPFPGAWTEIGSERLKLLAAHVTEGTGQPGQHLGEFRIACGAGAIQVTRAQRQGKRAMSAPDILLGLELPERL